MALSNKFGWLVLTTGNKSENSVGYSPCTATSAGGFAVIKDVPKTLVYRARRVRATRTSRARPPMPRIGRSIARRAPSCAPTSATPTRCRRYDVLDPILEAYVEEDQTRSSSSAPGCRATRSRRVISLVDRTEYKRRQAPPGIKITPRAFGRDRRMPITNAYRPRRPELRT